MAAGNNAIAQASVIISANADQMVKGLSDAEKRALKFALGLEGKMKSTGSKSGTGFMSSFLGGAVGGIAGAGLLKMLAKGPELGMQMFAALEQRAQGFDRGAMIGLKNSFQQLQDIGLGVLQKFVTAATPAIMSLVNSVSSLVDRFGPLITAVAEGFGEILFVVAELAGEILGLIDPTDQWQNSAMTGLRAVGKGFAFVWDAVKAGAGAMAFVGGQVTAGFEVILRAMARMVRAADDLLKEVPGYETFGLNGLAGAADKIDQWATDVKHIGDGISGWGINAMSSFGQSADMVDNWFDRVQKKLKDAKDKINGLANPVGGPLMGVVLDAVVSSVQVATQKSGPMFAGAIEKGSQEAYSLDVANRYGYETTDQAATQRELLAAAKRQADAAERAFEEMRTLNKTFAEGTV